MPVPVPEPEPVPVPVPEPAPVPAPVPEPVPVPVKAPPTGAKVPPTWVVPKVKAKAPPTWAEIDEWGNRPTEEKRRLMQEARRVMEGIRASASASADAIVYVPATGARFHSRPLCGNMKAPREVTRASAESMGYTRCENCW